MYPSVGTYTKKQVASIVCTKKKAIKLKIVDVQMQAGGCDCGLFAVAFATALANGIPPGKFTFDQSDAKTFVHMPTKGPTSDVSHNERVESSCESQEQG